MAGFSGRAGAGMIPLDSAPDEWPCHLCGDPGCREWPDVWALGPDGEPNGEMWYHVCECEMEDAENAEHGS